MNKWEKIGRDAITIYG